MLGLSAAVAREQVQTNAMRNSVRSILFFFSREECRSWQLRPRVMRLRQITSPDLWRPVRGLPAIGGGQFADDQFLLADFEVEKGLRIAAEMRAIVDVEQIETLFRARLRAIPLEHVSRVRMAVENRHDVVLGDRLVKRTGIAGMPFFAGVLGVIIAGSGVPLHIDVMRDDDRPATLADVFLQIVLQEFKTIERVVPPRIVFVLRAADDDPQVDEVHRRFGGTPVPRIMLAVRREARAIRLGARFVPRLPCGRRLHGPARRAGK